MSLNTSFDFSTEETAIKSAAKNQAQSYQELMWAVGDVWAAFVDKLGDALHNGGYRDLSADEAIRLYSLTLGGPTHIAPASDSARSMNCTTQLHRNGYLTRDEVTRTTKVTSRGIAAVALIDDVLEEQAFAISEDAPIQGAQLNTITRAMQILGRWIRRM